MEGELQSISICIISETHLLCSLLSVSVATRTAMSTSGKFRFLTLGFLFVVMGLTRADITSLPASPLATLFTCIGRMYKNTCLKMQPMYISLRRSTKMHSTKLYVCTFNFVVYHV